MDSRSSTSKGVLRLIDMNTNKVAEHFGPSGVAGCSDGYGSNAEMFNPVGLSFFPGGDKAVVCDTYNHQIRLVEW